MIDDDQSDLPILSSPAEGVPDVVASPVDYRAMLSALAEADGPVALDVERAQSYRYSGKAYLVQLRRPGAGSFLIDPILLAGEHDEIADFSDLAEVIGSAEWILHAASQDLPNLVQLGMRPKLLFDTELAGRLLGLPKVSLGAMVEQYCGVHLLKEHSAVDWSTRPLPADWLSYATLDVELLHELRDALAAELEAAGKQEWARQEFEWLCEWAVRPVEERADRWRRTSGTHAVHHPRGLALVRELWQARDKIAHDTDRAPGKILPDAAISELAALITRQSPSVPTARELRGIDGFKRRNARQYLNAWLDAMGRVAELPGNQLPPLRIHTGGIPTPRAWERANPDAWTRWNTVRPAVIKLAEENSVPVENLLAPEALRQLLWQPPRPLTVESVSQMLASLNARVWQQELVAPLVVELLS